jgi:hypothetical protein
MRKHQDEFAVSQKPTHLLSQAALEAQHVALRSRCEARLGLTNKAIEQMVGDYLASHGSATICPVAYATASRQYHLGRHA